MQLLDDSSVREVAIIRQQFSEGGCNDYTVQRRRLQLLDGSGREVAIITQQFSEGGCNYYTTVQ